MQISHSFILMPKKDIAYTYRRYGTWATSIFEHPKRLSLSGLSICPFVTDPKPAVLDLVADGLDNTRKVVHVRASLLATVTVSYCPSQHRRSTYSKTCLFFSVSSAIAVIE